MKQKVFIIVCIFLMSAAAFAQSLSDLKIADFGFTLFVVTTEWAGSSVHGYIIVADNGEAIIVDPVDHLTMVENTYHLSDPNTGQLKLFISNAELLNTEMYEYDDYSGLVTKKTTNEKYRIDNYYEPIHDTLNIFDQIIDAYNIKVKYIILTHGHLDHFAALNYLAQKTGATVAMNVNDVRDIDGRMLTDADLQNNIRSYPKDSNKIKGLNTPVDMYIAEGDTITVGDIDFQVLLLPGHSKGSIALYRDKGVVPVVFSGDVLLRLNVGRTNFKDGTGSNEELLNSLVRLKSLSENTVVYPGHGTNTTIGFEKFFNRYLNID